MDSMEFIEALSNEFKSNGNAVLAKEQKAYLRNQFSCYGLKTDMRREIQKPFLNTKFLPNKKEAFSIIELLWQKPEREYHYFAQELAFKYSKQLEKDDIALYEYMVVHNSWWDTVDFIANKLMGTYFRKYPEQREVCVKKWLASNNIWLQRSALLFQLKYKHEIDKELLSNTINSLLGSGEFFINKAIGWVLREYSRTNPDWVLQFTNTTALSTLSKREALRLIT